MTPIEEAVAPLKRDAIKRARKEAKTIVEYVRKELDKHGGDLDRAAPRPDFRRHNRREHQTMNARRALFNAVTSHDTSKPLAHFMSDPTWRVMSPQHIKQYIKQAEENAAVQYDVFVMKLVHKVGAHTSASLEGNHVWGYSILTVNTPNGVERWKTQQIINTSKLGLLFNQWPTRKLK